VAENGKFEDSSIVSPRETLCQRLCIIANKKATAYGRGVGRAGSDRGRDHAEE